MAALGRLIKAQAYGNDFLIAPGPAPSDGPSVARRLCDRHHGVGADGLIFTELTEDGARTHIFNQDGSPAEVSGNGVRCVAAWIARARHLQPGASIVVTTAAGPKRLTLLSRTGSHWTFLAAMGQPTGLEERVIDLHGEAVRASLLSMGNPQCVVFGDLTQARLDRLGRGLATHVTFKDGTNVELAFLETRTHLRILIWERGVGPTSSSGTGTCAAAVAAIAHHDAPPRLEVTAPGGRQVVEWTSDGVMLEGWAEVVAQVDWPLDPAGL
jgi:diaminopimelate epimerase